MSRENVYEVFGVAEAVRGVRGGWFDVGEDVDEVISIRVRCRLKGTVAARSSAFAMGA